MALEKQLMQPLAQLHQRAQQWQQAQERRPRQQALGHCRLRQRAQQWQQAQERRPRQQALGHCRLRQGAQQWQQAQERRPRQQALGHLRLRQGAQQWQQAQERRLRQQALGHCRLRQGAQQWQQAQERRLRQQALGHCQLRQRARWQIAQASGRQLFGEQPADGQEISLHDKHGRRYAAIFGRKKQNWRLKGEGIKKWKTQVGLAVGDRLRLHRRPDQPNSSSGGGITLDIERVLPVPPGTQLRAAQHPQRVQRVQDEQAWQPRTHDSSSRRHSLVTSAGGFSLDIARVPAAARHKQEQQPVQQQPAQAQPPPPPQPQPPQPPQHHHQQQPGEATGTIWHILQQ
ncbi:expressed protein [Chlorella variabilis]|uniref:Expressed protein n=1 Tax=Chlorella variabilis TaxID=554065 RepID=E1ZB32_CHLVA|nr:expressed protein [Chlorella variabilis]EFN57157.1 expressed protein [Chlorella variabilis]|eukprot:XP_005849259.1 expressed protein [Chlorella variabilis]